MRNKVEGNRSLLYEPRRGPTNTLLPPTRHFDMSLRTTSCLVRR